MVRVSPLANNARTFTPGVELLENGDGGAKVEFWGGTRTQKYRKLKRFSKFVAFSCVFKSSFNCSMSVSFKLENSIES